MGEVTSFALAGLELWFNSDDHLAPHFHAERPGDWEVRVYFLRDRADMFETKWSIRLGRPRRGDLRQLAALAEANRAELFAEWQQKVNVKIPGGRR
ncbi:MAG: DUF4160 domain-containing protein [Polyangiaceae bacterium]